MELNEYQKAAVLDQSDACIVNAKVGSGKTTVLTSKIKYLHEERSVSYEDMIVLTFTNKAADEIRERLDVTEQLNTFGTFHSVALYLLREKLPIEELGYKSEFAVITPEEEEELALDLIQEHKLKIKYRNRLKKRLEQERENYESGKMEVKYKDDLFLLMRLLGKEKLMRNEFTFRDLIRVSNYLLKKNLMANSSEKQKTIIEFHPRWVIVDEVQDCDKIQMEFLVNLKNYGASFFAVGDPNQVIYSWRGSSSRIFYQLKQQFHARELSLPLNYRSSNVILEAAKHFQQNTEELRGTRETGELIVVKNPYNAFGEANELAAEIRLLNQRGVPYREIAIFYRLQSQSEMLEKVFDTEGIPYEVSVKKTVQDIPILNWFLKKIKQDCQNQKLFEEASWKQKDDSQIEMLEISSKDIYDYLKIDMHLRQSSVDYQEEKEQILSMLDRMLNYTKERQLTLLDGFRQFLNSSALYGINILQKEVDMTDNSVKLMTLHASKGLEFSYVFIIGVNYGLIPLRTQNFEEEDEERRLFFVGITRAKDHLELSYYTNPGQPRVAEGESRYIQMIPEHLIQEENGQKTSSEYTTNGKVDLQKMRKDVERSGAMHTLSTLFETTHETSKDEFHKGGTKVQSENVQKVRHKKYGAGVIISEDDDMIEAEFENYGKKQFMKMFSELEKI